MTHQSNPCLSAIPIIEFNLPIIKKKPIVEPKNNHKVACEFNSNTTPIYATNGSVDKFGS
ncbi:MAG TPA: hypothetical protein DCL95_01225 [Rhodospirillaceae bacterium]|nr:hypothetical protein [Rhodospirillaceae bacterium]HBM12101.1 hypothetical protein [Rhodospirillaceae bacterium]